jgi:hypothetical protein
MTAMKEVADRLERLEQENGDLKPVDVVEDARDPTSPLHDFFEWDNDAAAQQYRLSQARLLIRRVKIQVTVHEIPMDVMRYVRDPDEPGSYANIVRVRNDEDRSRRTVLDEMNRVSKAAKRARSVAAVLGTVEQVDEIIRLAEIVMRRVEVTGEAAGAA